MGMERAGRRWILGALAALALVWLSSVPATAEGPKAPPLHEFPNGLCLLCHAQKTALVSERGEGLERSVGPIDDGAFGVSVHGEVECVECHRAQSDLPHPMLSPEERLTNHATELCIECHEEAYEGYLESVHGPLWDLGDPRAPTCVDCHGDPHEMRSVGEWSESERAQVCSGCHSGAGVNFVEAMSHEDPSPGSRPTAYFAERFLIILTAGVLAFAIIHVELDMLRWGMPKLRARLRRLLHHDKPG